MEETPMKEKRLMVHVMVGRNTMRAPGTPEAG
jgi:hypothetical protein